MNEPCDYPEGKCTLFLVASHFAHVLTLEFLFQDFHTSKSGAEFYLYFTQVPGSLSLDFEQRRFSSWQQW